MSILDHMQVKEVIKEIFSSDMVSDFVSFPSSVNTLLQFEINNEKYMIKILTLPTLSEWENYRLDKEGKLLEFFFKHDSIKVPVPELIHIENNIDRIGFRFIIYRFVDGIVLWNVWRDLTPQERIQIVKELGKIVRDIHSVTYDWFGELEDIGNVSKHSNYKDSMLDWIQELLEKIIEQKSLPIELVKKGQKFIQNNIDKITYKPRPTLFTMTFIRRILLLRKTNKECIKFKL